MDLNVYCCADGCLLLVPDCFAPSIRARHRYGPLRLMGAVSLDDIPRWHHASTESTSNPLPSSKMQTPSGSCSPARRSSSRWMVSHRPRQSESHSGRAVGGSVRTRCYGVRYRT